ncbi:MAG: T9SS type A sorting domain-containing protein [Bacteroidales bacterium]|nr:T9SS type A sorting domain-containing protein [Bacteroidales bacterium]
MLKVFFSLCLCMFYMMIQSAILWQQDFTNIPSNFYTTSGWTRNSGLTYACTGGNYAYYTSSTNAYFVTNTFNVPQGRGVRLTFNAKRANASAGSIDIYYLITGACSFSTMTPQNNGWVRWGTITPGTSGCSNFILNLESFISGGQNMAVVFYCPNASGTNFITVDDIVIDDNGPTSSPVPNISGATTYTENFTTNRWYGPVNWTDYATTGVQVPYRSYRSASDAYTYLFNNGSGGTGNHSGVWADYYAAFYTGFEFCNASSRSQIITRELNTSACPAPELKFAYIAKYPCSGNYDYTFDEDYRLWAPAVHVSSGQGYTWVELPVNYYFPDGLWHFAAYALPSSANIKLRFSRGTTTCTSPMVGVDHIKVMCRDCNISSRSGGTITGETNPAPNTNYTYTITPTLGATYYKWMIRAIDRDPPVVIEASCPNGTDPCIVSGQGTTTVTINFGNMNGEHFRVMCIPYDADPGTLANPSDACYAKISFLLVNPLPVEWSFFKVNVVDHDVVLEWETQSELNSDFFIPEKSLDGINFSPIGKVPAAGFSNQIKEYSFTDPNLSPGMSFYRIKQVDKDGKYSYSTTLSVINENPSTTLFISSPFTDQLTIETQYPILYPSTLSIYDIHGKIVYEQKNLIINEESSLQISSNGWKKGIYFVVIQGPSLYFTSTVVKL